MVERLTSFFMHRTIKRVLALLVFLFALVLLRHLAPLLVFYLIFSRGFGFLSERLTRVTPLGTKGWVLVLLVVLLGAAGGGIYAGVHRSIPAIIQLKESAHERVEALKASDLYKLIEAQHVDLDLKKYSEQVRKLSHGLVRSAKSTGKVLLHLVLGLILAVLYLLERKEVEETLSQIPKQSFLGYLLAFLGYLSEAVLLTIKVQVIVAAVNAIITLPILLLLRLDHIPTLMLMIFGFGLVPVVGNFLSGVVLSVLSYLKLGWLGVGIFLASTVVLHKVESYYLNPRLTAKHVKLPSLFLIASLIVWEHLFGIAGIFVSFPALYVALRIRDLFRSEPALAGPTPLPSPPTSTEDVIER
jgi:predicted PurR-regulated permease PerM